MSFAFRLALLACLALAACDSHAVLDTPATLDPVASTLEGSAHAGRMVPLKGRFAGAGADFSGNLTHLGRFVGVFDAATGTAVWTAANGDTMTNQTVSFVLVEEVEDGVFTYEQGLVITGGTGRFASAAGEATVTGTIDLATGAYDGVIDGEVSRPNRR